MIDKNKQYKTRDGREVRIYATDGATIYPVQGAVRCGDGWYARSWTKDGWSGSDGILRDTDLIEVKPRIVQERWANVYPAGIVCMYGTREEADKYALDSRIACVKITIDCEEGEGLCDQ